MGTQPRCDKVTGVAPVRAISVSAPRRPRWPEVALFFLVFGVFAYFYQAGGWNQNTRFDLVRAIVEQGTVRIDRFEKNTGDKAKRGKHYYADKAPGISLLSVPVYAVAHAIDGEKRETDRFQGIAAHVCTLAAVSLPSALAVVMLYQAARVFGLSAAARALLAVAYAFGTTALPYSTLLYGHQSAAAFSFIAFALLVSIRHGLADPGRGRLFLAGLCLGMAVFIEYTAALSIGVIALYAWASVKARRQLLWMAVGAALPVAILIGYHAIAFGGPFTLPYAFSTQEPRHRGFFMGVDLPSPRALYYLLIDEYRGLFYSAPWLLLAVPGAALLAKSRAFLGEGAVCGAIALSYIWLSSSLTDWHGGAGLGPRHLVAILPFLALCVGGLFAMKVSRGIRVAALVAAGLGAGFSMTLMLVGTAVKPEVPRAIEQPFQAYLFPHFMSGNLAINTQSIDMSTGRGRVVRQAWNLGEVAGLKGRLTLLPLAAYVLVLGAWLAFAARSADSQSQ